MIRMRGVVVEAGMVGLLFAVVGALVLSQVAAAVASPPMDAPEAVEASRAAEARAEQRRIARATPSRRAARIRSRTEHRALDPQQANALARQKFPAFVASPIADPLALPAGAHVREYLNDHWATIEMPNGQKAAAFSQLPTRVKQDGQLRRVRLGLQARTGGYRSENPLVDVRYGNRAPDGVELSDSAIGIRPVGASDVAGEMADDRLFFADVAADTDEILAPAGTGLQVLWQLRSEDSPMLHRLRFVFPEGAQLRLAEEFRSDINVPFGPSQDGIAGAEIVRDGKVLVSIAPPATFDSDGERVPTRYSVDGEVLTVHVAHHGRDLAYPLLVDPEINDGGWNGSQLGASNAWYPEEKLNGGANSFSFARNFERQGLQVGAYQGATYYDGATAGWNWAAPPGASITSARFELLRHIADNSALMTGIYRPGVWESGPAQWGHHFEPATHYHGVSAPTEGNIAFMGLYMYGTSQRLNGALASASGIVFSVSDAHPPQTTLRSTPNSAWTNNRWGAIGYDMTDLGLGINAATVSRVGNDTAIASGITNESCTGIRQPCPTIHNTNGFGGYGYSQQLPYDHDILGEGIHQLHVRAQDIAGNVSYSNNWTAKYDKTPPEIFIDGQLYEERNRTLPANMYRLAIHAHDVLSGTTRIRATVDGGQLVDTGSQACGAGACDMESEAFAWNASAASGTHSVEVVAYDAAGNTSTATWTVTLSGAPSDPNRSTFAPPAPTGLGGGCPPATQRLLEDYDRDPPVRVVNGVWVAATGAGGETTEFFADGSYRVSRCGLTGLLVVSQWVAPIEVPGGIAMLVREETKPIGTAGDFGSLTSDWLPPSDPEFIATWPQYRDEYLAEVIPATAG
jgi:hypothetical protein